ncbi:glycosyltransferase [Candidatus Reidiella endopervernicosa]|uniref:Glycosyltransferase n=1 Tax=Candidatus Reidiella endopervernicosa TaxID=2738883 RepID=A0A6N0HTT1_9GAMM|nr:glycosyltransferase [Candidatus Reidiella endopervernicosa]
MSVSVAMATYNGQKYLYDQLKSLAIQTVLPDELVICDDASSDDTLKIIDAFCKESPFVVRVIANKVNRGCIESFEIAIEHCTGDILLLCDQDDVWNDNKIEVVSELFDTNDSVCMLINDQLIKDEQLINGSKTKLGNIYAMGLTSDWHTTGCCTSFRRELCGLILPFPKDIKSHDGWIARIGISLGVRKVIGRVLQVYRRHETNLSNSISSNIDGASRFDLIRKYGLKDIRSELLYESKVLDELCSRINDEPNKPGVAIFARVCFGHPSPSKQQKLHATVYACGASTVLRTLRNHLFAALHNSLSDSTPT